MVTLSISAKVSFPCPKHLHRDASTAALLPHALVHKLALKQSISAKQGQKWWAGSLGWSICMADLGENGPRGTRAGGRLRPSCWARSTHLCERTRAAKRRDQPLRPLAAAARLPLYTTTGWW